MAKYADLVIIETDYSLRVDDLRLRPNGVYSTFIVEGLTAAVGSRKCDTQASGEIEVDPRENTREIVKRWNAYPALEAVARELGYIERVLMGNPEHAEACIKGLREQVINAIGRDK